MASEEIIELVISRNKRATSYTCPILVTTWSFSTHRFTHAINVWCMREGCLSREIVRYHKGLNMARVQIIYYIGITLDKSCTKSLLDGMILSINRSINSLHIAIKRSKPWRPFNLKRTNILWHLQIWIVLWDFPDYTPLHWAAGCLGAICVLFKTISL